MNWYMSKRIIAVILDKICNFCGSKMKIEHNANNTYYNERFGSGIKPSRKYLKVNPTSLTVMVSTISLPRNSRIIVESGLPLCLWIILPSSNVTTLLTMRPSKVSSSNSLPNSNVLWTFLNPQFVISVNFLSGSFFNSTIGKYRFVVARIVSSLTPSSLR